jgi:hypothetical protein
VYIPCIISIHHELRLTLTFDSIIKNVHSFNTTVKHRTLKTDSAIVDAVLRQSQALDCCNLQMQHEAVKRKQLENEPNLTEAQDMHMKIQGAMNVINAITDPEAKAEAYRKMLNDCCPDDI